MIPCIAVGGASRNYSHLSLPSPPSPSLSPPPLLPDDSLPQLNDHNDDNRRVPGFFTSDPISPLKDLKSRRPTRTCQVNRTVNTLTVAAKREPRKAEPIKVLLRQRKKEARTGGIDALNRAEDYDHDTLLSDLSIEAEEPVDATRSGSVVKNSARVPVTGLQAEDADIVANALEDEVQQDDRERLLGAKEGEAVGKILDADRKMGQSATYSVSGVSVFVNVHEVAVDAKLCTEVCPTIELAKGKTATLDMLNEAIEQQGAQECLYSCRPPNRK